MPPLQVAREIAVTTVLADDKLLFRRMRVKEQLGRLTEFDLELFSKDDNIKIESVLGTLMTVRLKLPEGRKRYFNAHVTRFCQTGRVGNYAAYKATLHPWLWFLTRTADCRIFQDKTVPEIIKEIFREHGFSDFIESLSQRYRKWTYCVQYRETDFDFVNRLMEQEGIYYYFNHDNDIHTLVLSDSYSSHDLIPRNAEIPYVPLGGSEIPAYEHIYEWSLEQQIQPGCYVLNSFDFKKPRASLEVKSRISRQHSYADSEIFDYPADYLSGDDGMNYARTRIEALQAQYEQVTGAGDARGLAVGALFKLTRFPREDQNREYLIVSATHELISDEYETTPMAELTPVYTCNFTAIESKAPYRSPRVTPKPFVQGPQTAVVVGKSGEDIWTDKYGRVKVQFHWDRYGKNDENSSCWVRVSHPWAGKNWGAIAIPRIGQEVIVDFLEGDPDQPLITGRVYNADQMPPYALPDNMTQTGILTRTTKEGNAKTCNELRFEDKKDVEEIYLHAEKDMNVVVENNATLKVGFDKKDPGDQKIDVYKNRTVTIDQGNDKLQIKTGNRDVLIDKGNHTISIAKGNDKLDVGTGNREVIVSTGNHSLSIKTGNQTTKIDLGKSSLEAMQSIELKVGSNSVKIDQTGVTIKGIMVTIEGTAKADIKSPMTSVNGDGMVMVKGGIVMIN